MSAIHNSNQASSHPLSSSTSTPKADPAPILKSSTSRSHHRNTINTVNSTSNSSAHIKHGAHHTPFSKIPLLHRPQVDANGPWLNEEQRGQEWISLFYDLAVVAALTIFSSSHELNSPATIPVFFGYFVILNWIWGAQTHYDIRFQAADTFHRICKGIQLISFVYIGAASGNWSPSNMRDDDEFLSTLSSRSAAQNRAAAESFQTVAITFLVSRAGLAIQYIVCILNGRRVQRRIAGPLISVISLTLSALCALIAIVIPAHSQGGVIAKIAVFFSSIIVEIIGVWVQFRRNRYGHVDTKSIGERYGAFTLIILGEGFISLTRAFNSALSGLSVSSSSTYLQVFLAITIIYLLWSFLFARFRPEDQVKPRKMLLWEFIHFPMHFNLLLLLAAMVNTIVCLAYARGLSDVSNQYFQSIASIVNSTSTPSNAVDVERFLDRLYLEPDYATEINILQTLGQEDNPAEDPTILAYQYLAQITLEVSDSYGLEIEDEMVEALEEIYSLNTTWSGNETLQSERQAEAITLTKKVITIPAEQALSGVLWLFPTAGAALIFSAIRSMTWYHFQGPAHIVVHSIQIIFGVALALLGLLDIGKRSIDVFADSITQELDGVNPMYWLVHTRVPLLVVMLVYAVVYIGTYAILTVVHRRRGTVWPDEEKVSNEGQER